MAQYTRYKFNIPNNNLKEYMPYDIKQPSATYRDSDSPYRADIARANAALSGLSKPKAYSSAYSDRMNELIGNISKRKFSYDVNADPLYQQYKHSYMTQGKQAMEDTIGKAAAMTGGYGNSYAAAAGNQAYNSYLDKLNDRLPELYQLAMQKYNLEGSDLQNLYSVLANQDATDYSRYRDTIADYQTDRNYYENQLNNLRSMSQNLWGKNWDNYQNAANMALQRLSQDWENYKWGEQQTAANRAQAVSEDQWNANFAENQRQFNASQAAAAAARAASSGSSSGASQTIGLTQNYSNARNNILTRYEYERNGINRRYNGYEDYVKQKIDKNKDLTDMERLVLYKDLLGVR